MTLLHEVLLYNLDDFLALYGSDPFYSWIGLNSPYMFAAHKAAGCMTSIYRQIGTGCERLFRAILTDTAEYESYESSKWSYITKTKEADIKVLDMPLLDTRIEGKNLVGKFISDIVLQVLSFVAENERNNIRERQAEGIRIAKEKGIKFGRPKASTPPNTNEILDKYINHEITNTEAAELLDVSRGTFFRLVKERKRII